jgi:hypothetical protein
VWHPVRPSRRDRSLRKAPMLKARSGVLAVITAGFVLTFPAAPVLADSPAFWGYWHADASNGGKWAFAQTGPASSHPKDGSIEGWRFARSSGDTGTPPRGKADFAKACGTTPAKAGSERVAVVIDYGDPADAPDGTRPPVGKVECAVVPKNSTGSAVLAKVAAVKADKSGLICAIDVFGPCGGPAAAAAPSPTASAAAAPKKKSAGSKAVTVGIGLLLILAAGGSMMAVRRRARQ